MIEILLIYISVLLTIQILPTKEWVKWIKDTFQWQHYQLLYLKRTSPTSRRSFVILDLQTKAYKRKEEEKSREIFFQNWGCYPEEREQQLKAFHEKMNKLREEKL